MIRRSLRRYGPRSPHGGLGSSAVRAALFYMREKNRERREAAIIQAGSFVASASGALVTLVAPLGFSFPTEAQNVELLTLDFDDATLQVDGTDGTAGEVTEVDDVSTIYSGLTENSIARGIASVDLVRDSDSETVSAIFRILVVGAA